MKVTSALNGSLKIVCIFFLNLAFMCTKKYHIYVVKKSTARMLFGEIFVTSPLHSQTAFFFFFLQDVGRQTA
jgi:hypothetical protein